MAQGKQKKPTVDEVISKAVIATRLSCAREPKDVFKATEKRLYAYPVLQAKIKDDEEMLEEIEQYGLRGRSKSITRFIKSGIRLEPDEIKEAVMLDLRATIDGDKYEISRIDKAIEQIADDEYRDIIRYKYFEQKSEDEIADLMHCAPRTVRAHKSRLVWRLSVFLYGAGALA
ncbi:MAG: sigma-70 region 4 domain-containing protein [Dysosmobacter sp.]|nr:sigma-70 region 4 domain-containing protein [Dysosmobacter sp.]